tara:strand:+ start:322 stop:702 length:381 start_codon:yes stop_codon:yes gene_type:complete
MKQLLVTLFLGLSSISYSQDTLQIPQTELEEFFLALDTLRTQDSAKAVLIQELEFEIKLHEQLAKQDSLIILYKDQEIGLLNEEIDLYIYRLDKVDKWYNRPWVGAVGGFIGTIVLINTIEYTLPD